MEMNRNKREMLDFILLEMLLRKKLLNLNRFLLILIVQILLPKCPYQKILGLLELAQYYFQVREQCCELEPLYKGGDC